MQPFLPQNDPNPGQRQSSLEKGPQRVSIHV